MNKSPPAPHCESKRHALQRRIAQMEAELARLRQAEQEFAIKYSPPAENISIELTLMGANASLRVRDEGIGVPEVDRKYLFEPFHRGTHVGTIPGLGLGLGLIKQIVELHQRAITVDSQPGRGTTVGASLPATLKE